MNGLYKVENVFRVYIKRSLIPNNLGIRYLYENDIVLFLSIEKDINEFEFCKVLYKSKIGYIRLDLFKTCAKAI